VEGSCSRSVGSIYYLITGIAFIVTAVLLYLRRSLALTLYALIVLGSLGWAIWEVGFDWWQLGPRGGVIILLGIWLLTPWIRKPLGFQSPTGRALSSRRGTACRVCCVGDPDRRHLHVHGPI
jgi:glucose dehydrogenase